MECLLLAAGRGTRMRPLDDGHAKPLLPVAGRPLLEHLLRSARAAGLRRFRILASPRTLPALRRHFGNGAAWRVGIRYLKQPKPLGTGDALRVGLRGVKGNAIVLPGDAHFEPEDLRPLVESDAPALAAAHRDDATPYGLLRVRGKYLEDLREKPGRGRRGLVNTGAYKLPAKEVQAHLGKLRRSSRGEYEATDALTTLNRESKIRVLKAPTWRDVTYPWHLLDLNAHLLARLPERRGGARFLESSGPVHVEPGARIRRGVAVDGPCLIQRGARVGPHSYLRGATVVGPQAHVGAHTEIKNSLLLAGANVPHLSYVGDSILGERVNLGAGTSTANLKVTPKTVRAQQPDGSWIDTGRRKFGAVLGDDVKTGINVSLQPGTLIGSRTLINAGRVVSGWVEPDSRVL